MNQPLRPAADAIAMAREVLEIEAAAVSGLIPTLDRHFVHAVELVLACSGRVVVTNHSEPEAVILSTEEYTRLTWSPHPGVDLATLVKPELRTFKAHDGLALSGWLYLPKDFKAPGPVVLSFHGGPEGQGRRPRSQSDRCYAFT